MHFFVSNDGNYLYIATKYQIYCYRRNYEFTPAGRLIGLRAFLQDSEYVDIREGSVAFDNQRNIYYLHFLPKSTEVWLAPAPEPDNKR